MPNWDITPIAKETPLWQYETPTMNHGGGSAVYYATQTPLSPSYTNTSSCHSTLNSPLTAGFPQDARYTPQPVTPLYENISKPSNRPVSLQLQPPVAVANELMDEDGDSDTCSWEPKVAIPRPTRPMHRRSASANEVLARNAKRAHTVVVSHPLTAFHLVMSIVHVSMLPFFSSMLWLHPLTSLLHFRGLLCIKVLNLFLFCCRRRIIVNG